MTPVQPSSSRPSSDACQRASPPQTHSVSMRKFVSRSLTSDVFRGRELSAW